MFILRLDGDSEEFRVCSMLVCMLVGWSVGRLDGWTGRRVRLDVGVTSETGGGGEEGGRWGWLKFK